MQYFKPADSTESRFFVGDCMPFFHDGLFHLYYLRDENHHGALGGLGGHQWAHASSSDLVTWTHHPLAIALTNDWERSICTGSTFFHNRTYYGFYATRKADWTQHLGLATSPDGVTFTKTEPNPLASPPAGYDPHHFRDPFVFWDDGTQLFHMLVTAMHEDYPLYNLGGCLAHLTSPDLHGWTMASPFIVPGLPDAPECSDYFSWHGWYYLLFSNGLVTRYRMSRQPFGPWLRPKSDILDGPAMRVMKTAAFTGDRRIGAAWIGTREHDKDSGRFQWGGHAVFREIVQHDDGTLGTKFVPEMIPAPITAMTNTALTALPITTRAQSSAHYVHLEASQSFEAARISGIPNRARIMMRIIPKNGSTLFGLRLKANEATAALESGCDLIFRPLENRVELLDQVITCVNGLDQPFDLDIVFQDDIIDMCLAGQRCLINRLPEQRGQQLFLFAHYADVVFDRIEVLVTRFDD